MCKKRKLVRRKRKLASRKPKLVSRKRILKRRRCESAEASRCHGVGTGWVPGRGPLEPQASWAVRLPIQLQLIGSVEGAGSTIWGTSWGKFPERHICEPGNGWTCGEMLEDADEPTRGLQIQKGGHEAASGSGDRSAGWNAVHGSGNVGIPVINNSDMRSGPGCDPNAGHRMLGDREKEPCIHHRSAQSCGEAAAGRREAAGVHTLHLAAKQKYQVQAEAPESPLMPMEAHFEKDRRPAGFERQSVKCLCLIRGSRGLWEVGRGQLEPPDLLRVPRAAWLGGKPTITWCRMSCLPQSQGPPRSGWRKHSTTSCWHLTA